MYNMPTLGVLRISPNVSHTNDNAVDSWGSEFLEYVVVNRL